MIVPIFFLTVVLAAILSLFRLIGLAAGATVAHKAVLVDVGGVLTFGSSSRALLGQGVRGLLAQWAGSDRKLLATSAGFGAGIPET